MLANANTGLGATNQGSTVSIRSGGVAAPSNLLDDKRNLNFGSGKERSQKILDQNSKEVLDYLGAYENSIESRQAAGPPQHKTDRSLEQRRDRSI